MRPLAIAAFTLLISSTTALTATAGPPNRGFLYYDGQVVRTLVPPSANPGRGLDPLFGFTNGVEGQLAVTATAPGNPNYRGGQWAFYSVTFVDGVEPYRLTSNTAIQIAYNGGDITIARIPARDFRCPIQP